MSQRKQIYTLDQMIAELLRMDSQIIHGSDFFNQVANHLESTRKDNEKMREALILILPMAKGYAYNHPVGDNWKMIEQAEGIALTPNKDGQ